MCFERFARCMRLASHVFSYRHFYYLSPHPLLCRNSEFYHLSVHYVFDTAKPLLCGSKEYNVCGSWTAYTDMTRRALEHF